MDANLGKRCCRSCECLMYSGFNVCMACGAGWIYGSVSGLFFELIQFERDATADADSPDTACVSAAVISGGGGCCQLPRRLFRVH